MTVMYSDPVKNADINKSKAALVEIIDELRTRFARKNDAWSEAQATADQRLALLNAYNESLQLEPDCFSCDIMAFDEDAERWIHHAGCKLAEEIGT